MTVLPDLEWSNGEYQIETVIPTYNLVLGDTSFLGTDGIRSNERGSNLGRELYQVKTLPQLALLHDRLRTAQLRINWQIMNIAFKPNVYTTEKVVAEIKQFEDILEKSVNWLNYSRRKKAVEKFHKGKGFGRSRRRANKKTARISQELRADDIEFYDGNESFKYLNALLYDVRGMSSFIKIYNGPVEPLLRSIPGISATDYGLVEAALGYALANEETRVAILSNDTDVTVALGEYEARNYLAETTPKVDVFYHVTAYTIRKASPLERFLERYSPKEKKKK